MVKDNSGKGKQRQSLRTSLSQKYSKAKVRPRRQKSLVPASGETFGWGEDSEGKDSTADDAAMESEVVTAGEESDHRSTTSSHPSSPRPATTRLGHSTSIVPSALSSTISNWMSKKATTSNDQC